MQFFFISRRNHNGKTLEPRIPKHRMREEDSILKRICVSNSIVGCLAAVGGLKEGNTVYIHTCQSENIIYPTIDQVPDVNFTGEVWITHLLQMTLIQKIKITKVSHFEFDPENGIDMTNYQYKIIHSKRKENK